MKRVLSLALVALICAAVFVGCGNTLPNEAYNIAKSTVETVDKYLNFEIDSEEAASRIKKLESRIKKIDNDVLSENYNKHLSDMAHHITMITICFGSKSIDEDEILERTNKIAEIVGLPKI